MAIEVTRGEWRMLGDGEPNEVDLAIIRRCELRREIGELSTRICDTQFGNQVIGVHDTQLSDIHFRYTAVISEIMDVNQQLRNMGVDTQGLAREIQAVDPDQY